MKNKKVLILVTSIILIIICILLLILVFIKNSKDSGKVPDGVEMDRNVYSATNKIVNEKNVATYMTANNCVKKYMDYILDENKEALKSILTTEYIKEKDINQTNIMDNVNKIENGMIFNTEKIYSYDNDFYFNIYLVIGKMINTNTNSSYNCRFLLNIDGKKLTFRIAPLGENNYINYTDGNIKNINTEIFEKITREIERNDYNLADLAIGIGDKEVVKYYYNQYVLKMKYDVKNAYDKLDEEYKTKRFNNYNDFKEYADKVQNDAYNKGSLMKYKIVEYDDCKEYLCIDNFNNYYIFKETNPTEYTVMLDQYTVEDKIYQDTYVDKDKKERAQLILNLVNQMINTQDYKALYNVLDEDFKNKYFQNEEDLEKYIEKNIFKYNDFKYSEILDTNNGVRIKTEISDCENDENQTIKRFLVKIEKDKYYISFDI